MRPLNSIELLLAAFVAVFCQAAFHGLHHLLGAQINLLPPLIVCASLRAGMTTMVLVAALGGLCFDALSENPLGVSVLPLCAVGFLISWKSELILRDQVYAQLVLGLFASASVPLLTLLLLLTSGHPPLLGWATWWQWLVLSAGGTLATPLWFRLLARLEHGLNYRRTEETSFRPDREIRRGRF